MYKNWHRKFYKAKTNDICYFLCWVCSDVNTPCSIFLTSSVDTPFTPCSPCTLHHGSTMLCAMWSCIFSPSTLWGCCKPITIYSVSRLTTLLHQLRWGWVGRGGEGRRGEGGGEGEGREGKGRGEAEGEGREERGGKDTEVWVQAVQHNVGNST